MINQPEKNRTSLFGPVVLIGLGILLLLSNFGFINVNIWDLIFRFWPLFLVAAGLDLLLGRRTNSGALIGLVVVGGLVVGAIWFGYFRSDTSTTASSQTIRQALEGATNAEIEIESSISKLQINTSEASEQLIEGTVALHNDEELETDFEVLADTARYSLKSKSRGFIFPNFGGSDAGLWDLRLNGEIPTALSIDTGIGSSNLDLETLQLTALEVNAGIGAVEITLPDSGDFEATIEGGVGEIVVMIPDTLAARITANAGIGTAQVEGNYINNGEEYRSPDFDSATNRVILEVDGGVGSITIRQVSKR